MICVSVCVCKNDFSVAPLRKVGTVCDTQPNPHLFLSAGSGSPFKGTVQRDAWYTFLT